jgi:hypothetical protein
MADVAPRPAVTGLKLYRFLPPVELDFRRGTLAPLSRASLSPMAIACFRLVTLEPELLLSVPFFRRLMADFTRF